jgi:signal transduction histidine kinase
MGRGPKPAKGKAKPAVARKSPKDEGARVRDLENRLAEALRDKAEAQEQQAATAEILRVISSSPTDVQPVFDAIVANAAQLCDAEFSAMMRFEGGLLHLVAVNNMSQAETAAYHTVYPRSPGRDFVVGRAFVEARPVHVEDIEADPDYNPRVREIVGRAARYRTILGVPILRDGVPIGVFGCGRHKMKPFTAAQIALLQAFADQAVIAIENVRLFNETKEALEQQTATAEILRVISSSPTDSQPVVDSIAAKALDLCKAKTGAVFRFDGELIHVVAAHSFSSEAVEAHRQTYPIPPGRGGTTARAILSRAVVYIPDIREDSEYEHQALAKATDYLSALSVPMLHESEPVGAITVTRAEAGAFSQRQIELLKTFADQAVIAIENVRLFKELETRNRDLTEALDRQTATAEILRVISQSQTEVQPVFDAIVDHAMRLFRAWAASIVQLDGQLLHLIAVRGGRPGLDQYLREQSPWSIDGTAPVARCIVQRTVVHVPDTELDHDADEAIREIRRRGGMRSILAAPMLRDGQPIGGIWISRVEAGPFSPAEIALLQTFADQAVIAIENARLLSELQARTQELTRSVEQLTALGDVGRAVSSSLDLDTVLTTIVGRAIQLSGTDGGTIFEYVEATEEFVARATLNADEGQSALLRSTRLRRGEGAVGQMAVTREPFQILDIAAAGAYESRLRGAMLAAGTRSVLAIPLLHEDRLVGGLVVTRNTPGEFTTAVVEMLRTFASQSALAIQNARLFREIEEKSRQLEVASQHKSEFLANMSHELRTPLNAIIGFSEVLTDRMFGELNEKQDEYLKDIYASGTHLLSLINDILDLSKIEAGRMELELSDFHLPTALDSALTLVRERAGRRNMTLQMSIDEGLGEIQGDERKIRQVVLNLLSNAIKFTPEGGRIEIAAVPKDGSVEVSVSDTGIGIAPEDQEKVFEEFRQVGTADKKAEGTGLGLTLCRKFIELHRGKIWVKSQVGVGSTFTFTIPVRQGV